MDFLKNLNSEKEQHREGSEIRDHQNLFNKIGGALGGDHTGQTAQQQHQLPVAHSPVQNSGFLGKIGVGGDNSSSSSTQAIPPIATPKHDGLFDKISGALSGEHSGTTQQQQQPVVTSESSTQHSSGFLGKINSALGSNQPAAPSVARPSDNDNFLGKIANTIGGEHHQTAAQPTTSKQEGLLGKLSDAIGGHKQEAAAKPQGLGDTIHGFLGGGKTSEAKEGPLDKAIDLFQEHVLKEGPQNNESFVEQAKDKQIAEMLKGQFERFQGKK